MFVRWGFGDDDDDDHFFSRMFDFSLIYFQTMFLNIGMGRNFGKLFGMSVFLVKWAIWRCFKCTLFCSGRCAKMCKKIISQNFEFRIGNFEK